MTVSVISFTGRGRQLSRILSEELKEERVLLYTGERTARTEEGPDWQGTNQSRQEAEIVRVEDLAAWAGAQFAAHRALLFIGACGIAVRSIAPFVQNKLTDSPVLVMDEGGGYVIPILSGHAGGADRLAHRIAECVGAVPVITAATDINGKFAVDVFAQRHGLFICDRAGIGRVSARILRGESVTVAAEGMTAVQCRDWFVRKIGVCPAELVSTDDLQADIWIGERPRDGAVLWLRPKVYILGMGCKRGKAYGELRAFAEEMLEQAGISQEEIYALTSIDRKRGEAGFWDLADSFRAPFLTFSAEELKAVPGKLEGSAFVQAQVGVDNVCERAALLCSGAGGRIVLGKISRRGMTLAIARREWTV